MTRIEKMDYLISRLIEENPRFKSTPILKEESEKWELLRSLMNVRHPGSIDDSFLRVQDELLTELISEKGITDASKLPVQSENERLCLWQGDITTLKIDAIVNAANNAMLGCFQPCHNCIDNAIHTYAGVQLRNECFRLMQAQGHDEPTGWAKITEGYNLPVKHVLHTVGPIISGEAVSKEDERMLESCYSSCLKLAVENQLESIVFCCISTGVFRFPKKKAASIAVNTVNNFIAENEQIKRVIFNVFTDEDKALYQEILGINV